MPFCKTLRRACPDNISLASELSDTGAQLTSIFPAKTPPMQRTRLAATYIPNISALPLCKSPRASSENVENVVNPPHMPTFRNSSQGPFGSPYYSAACTIIPIITAPMTFTASV